MLLTREQILKTRDYDTKDVVIPEWGGASVRIRSLSLRERGILLDRPGTTNIERLTTICLTVTFCAIDEKGEPLFTEEDVAALSHKSEKAMERLANAILELSGIGVKPEDVEKNSAAAPTGS